MPTSGWSGSGIATSTSGIPTKPLGFPSESTFSLPSVCPVTTSGSKMTSIEAHVQQPYKYGFVTDIESEIVPPGLNEDVIRLISAKKGEPAWMLEWRLKAYRNWLKMSEPHWPNVKYGPIDYQAISYYAAPKQRPKLDSLEQGDPKLLGTVGKRGSPIEERKRLPGGGGGGGFRFVS